MSTKKNKFASFKQVDVGHLQENAHIFPGAYDALDKLGLIPFVSYAHPLNEDLVMQFYATVYFHNNDERTMTWMSSTSEGTTPFRKFTEIIPYEFFTEAHPDYAQLSKVDLTKDVIAFAYKQERSFVSASIKGLLLVYDTMCHILRYSITPKAGDSHNLRGSMFDLFLMIRDEQRIDVVDIMFREMRECVHNQKSLIFSPLIQALIESVC